MSSHAYQVNSKLSPDVDGDGRGDVGTICQGRYVLRDLKTGKYPTLLVTMPDGDGHLPCWRDTNHDGIVTNHELTGFCTATQILVHGGIDDPPDSPHHFSIGCCCVPLVWRRELIARLGPDGLADFILVNAEDAARLMTGEAPQNIA